MLIKEGDYWIRYIPDFGESVTVSFDSEEAKSLGKRLGTQVLVKLNYLAQGKVFTVNDLSVFEKFCSR